MNNYKDSYRVDESVEIDELINIGELLHHQRLDNNFEEEEEETTKRRTSVHYTYLYIINNKIHGDVTRRNKTRVNKHGKKEIQK